MSIEDKDELAQEFAEFGYRETSDPNDADRRNFYKVEKWDAAELDVEALIHASNDLECARAIFATEKNRRPRGCYTLRQGIRVLERAGRPDNLGNATATRRADGHSRSWNLGQRPLCVPVRHASDES